MKAKTKLAFIGQAEYFRFHYENDLSAGYEVYSHQLRYGATPEYYADLVDFDADINIFFRGELVPVEVIRRLSGQRVALSTEPFPKLRAGQFDYTIDSLGRFRAFLDIFHRDFDYIFHYDPVSQEFFEFQGIKLSGFIALPIATGTYKLHRQERRRDVLFIGRSTPHREQFLGAIKRDFDCLHIAHGLPTAELPALSSGFKMSFNLHAENELSWEPRVQLALACGDLLLSEPISPNPLLLPGQHFIQVASPGEAYETCKAIVQDPARFEHIRNAGYEQVQTNLSSARFFPTFFDELASRAYAKPACEPARIRLGALEICKRHPGFEHLLEELTDFHA